MKCISKTKSLLSIICLAALFMTGCASAPVENAYRVYDSSLAATSHSTGNTDYFAKNLCVTGTTDFGTEQTDAWVAQGAGAFNLTTNEVLYNQNIYGKLYPASTTKILTALIICKYGNLDDYTTVSAHAADQAPDSSVAYLAEGDVLSVRDLLYGLMLCSGNDAAIALAEYYSGSEEAFAEVMNQEAAALGATNSHFVNPHGLPDDNHYTTVYDMYLLFSAAIENETFVSIISTKSYDANYTNKNGDNVTHNYHNTNGYLKGNIKTPDGFQVIGGKTGTTFEAGYCLVLLSQNSRGEKIVSIVFKADCRHNLYLLMNEILSGFAN